MEDIDSWEKLTNEQVGVYLSDKRDSINVSQFADGTDTRYQYETGVENKNPHEYLGKIRHKYQEIHRNPLSTFSRNAWNGLMQLPEGVAEEAVNLGEALDVKLLNYFGGDADFEKKLNAGAIALRKKLKNWFDEYKFENPERIKENKFVADLGQGAGSLFAALGLTLATKSPNAAAGLFGVSQAGNLTSEMRDRGIDIDRANTVGLIGGTIEGSLEKIGLHMWFENFATKKLGTFLAKQAATEFTQEASQTAAEESLMRAYGGRINEKTGQAKTVLDIAKESIYSGVMGAILGFAGGAVSIPGTEAFKSRAENTLVESGMTEEQAKSLINERIYGTPEQQQELLDIVNEGAKQVQVNNIKNKLMEAGVKESKANEMAYDLVVTPKELGEDLVETLNKEADNDTLLNGSYEDDVKDFIEKENVDIVAEAFDVKEELKEKFMTEGGVQEDEAEAAATLVENFAKTVYNLTGETPREYIERKGLNVLDDRYPAEEDEIIDESELTEEEIARLDAQEQPEDDIPFFQETETYNEEGKADINSPEFKEWSNNAPFYEANKAEEHKFKTGQPLVAEVFHGTQRADRVGSVFLPSRATSGPMAFSTDTRSAAEGYANTKRDTSIYNETEGDFHKYFKVKIPNYNAVTLDRLWAILPYSKKQEMREKAPHITTDENGENIIYDENETRGNGGYYIDMHGNNALEALVDAWMMSGSLWNEEEKFQKVMELAGLGEYEIQYVDPNAIYPKVYELYVEMQKPLVSYDVPKKVITALDKASKKQSRDVAGVGTDFWDKNTRDPIAWIEALKEGDAYVWTSIPDWVTNTLKKMGYDGIVDTGGKGGGTEHNVFIPFASTQYKSVYNKGMFSKENPDIYYQFAGEKAQTAALDKLDRAKQLEANGVDNEEIRQQTGWFKGADGKWRFEISDKDADFHEGYNIDKWKENGTYFEGLNFKLGKILKHDKLFSAYPELKDVNIEFENRRTDDGTLGSFVKAENKIYLSNQLNSKKALSVIMHELQHVIQHKEGFASGGSLETKDVLEEKYKEIIEKYDYSPEMQALERDLDRYEFLYDIVNTLEVAENPQKIINKNWYKEKVFGTPKGKYRKSFIEEKAQQFIDEIKEKYLSKSSWYYSQYLEYVQDGKLKEIKKEMNALGKSTWRRMKKKKPSEYTDAKSFLWELENSGGYDIYRRLAGEIEARNTQARMELTEEERRAKTPESTQDIKNADAIVVFDDGTAMAYEPKKVKRGSYNPKTRTIELFKQADHSTIIHELGHVFTMDYIKILEEAGRTDELKGFYEWLGINDISEATTETWEKMARGFETYIMEGQAPNISTQNLFDRLRQWLVGVYQDLKGKVIKPEEINNDVREFFDKMLAQDEEMPDITSLKGRTEDILKIIQAAQKGESISVNGLSIEDVKKLVKASRARLPRMPKTLEQDIRAYGGIDIQLAKSLGIYDEKKGNRSGFFKKDGAITREDSLIEFLQDAGYLEQAETDTYEQTAELQDKAIELIEKADRTYTPERAATMAARQELESIASEAMAELSSRGIKEKELFSALKTLKSVDMTAINKDTLKYLKSQLKSLEKDYKKFMKNTLRNQRKDFTEKQNEMIDFIKAMPLTGEDKVKLLAKVKKAKFIDDFNRAAREIFNKGRALYENEQKKLFVSMIKKEIRKSKPTEVTKQRYDYENNKLFADLRKWNNLTQAQAQEELAKIEVNEDKDQTDLIRIRFLNYKANGMDSSIELMEEVYNDIINAKEAGKLAKGDIDVAKAVNRELLKRDVLKSIEQNDADKNTFKTKFTNLYRRGLTNLYSMLNSIASKEIADRFEMETVINNAEIKTYKHIENLTNEILNILNLKSKGQLLDHLAEMGRIIDNITDTEGRVRELSKLHILDIYNAMKNDKTKENYLNAYGEEQLARVLRYLTPQDIMLADILMEDVNTLYPETNKVYIENYGMDLKKVDNYWMATSEHHEDTDLLGESMMQQTVPSFLKERVKGSVVPIPKNAWSKYLKHVKQSIYLINTANKYKELADTFKSSRVKNAIQTKYGEGVYKELRSQIDRLSLNGKSEDLNYLESAFGTILNNFVVAKIAVAPTVFVGQLTSITNYSESIKTGQFYKNFAEGLAHPKQTINYMKKVAGDFLESRYKGGYSEAISRVLSEAEDANKKKYTLSIGTKYNVVNALTSWVRTGDIGAIIFGGYAQIKSNIENGMSLEDATKKFEFDTLRSQQSSNAASLSSFQQSKGFARMFLAFKNTQHQYLRKLADSIISYERGEIGTDQLAKTVLNYAVVQTSMYVIAKNLVKAALGLSGDDDDLTDGVIEQILIGSLDAIPILSDLLRYTYKRLTKQYAGGIVNMPGVDDIEKAINKLAKQKKDVYDYVDIISPLIEGTTSLPVQRFKGMLKKYIGE